VTASMDARRSQATASSARVCEPSDTSRASWSMTCYRHCRDKSARAHHVICVNCRRVASFIWSPPVAARRLHQQRESLEVRDDLEVGTTHGGRWSEHHVRFDRPQIMNLAMMSARTMLVGSAGATTRSGRTVALTERHFRWPSVTSCPVSSRSLSARRAQHEVQRAATKHRQRSRGHLRRRCTVGSARSTTIWAMPRARARLMASRPMT
jgi:hypothetical protein